jgi:uncharacterized protein (TIRG00374 family)
MKQLKGLTRQQAVIILLIVGLIAFVAYFYFYINPAQLIEILAQTNLVYFAGAFIAYSLYVLFSSLVWQNLLTNLSIDVSKRKALLYTWVGLFFEATVPQLGWSAEISKTYLLSKDTKVDAERIGASVVGQKIFVMTLSVAALAIGLTSVLVSYSLPPLVTFLIALVLGLSALTLSVVYYISVKPSATQTLLNWAIRIVLVFRKSWDPQSFKDKADGWLSKFHRDIEQLKANPRQLIRPIITSIIAFVCEVSVLAFAFLALGQAVPVNVILIVFTLTGTLQTVGVTFFGFPEIIMATSFEALGIAPASLGLAVTLLARVVNLWFRLVVSYAALQYAGLGILKKNPAKQAGKQ